MAFQRQSFQNFETKANIVRALDELLAEKPFDKVTIAEICKRAPVSKSTFYRNFDDKPAVVEWYTQHLLARSVAKIGSVFGWRDAYVLFFKELQHSRAFFCAAAQAKGYRSMRRSSRRTAVEDFTEHVAYANDPVLEFQARYFASTMIDVICDWVEGGMAGDPERLADLLLTLLPKELESAFMDAARDAQGGIVFRL